MIQALRCGCTVSEFWSMTPVEAYKFIEATNWRHKQLERREITMAWLTAALTRTKRLPKLKPLLAQTKRPKKLTGEQLQERRREFKELATPEKLARINEAMKRK
jgi:hypothetical protein